MALSSLSVIVNSATLKRLKLSREQPSGMRPGEHAQHATG
jgi:hypothetical protein